MKKATKLDHDLAQKRYKYIASMLGTIDRYEIAKALKVKPHTVWKWAIGAVVCEDVYVELAKQLNYRWQCTCIEERRLSRFRAKPRIIFSEGRAFLPPNYSLHKKAPKGRVS